MASSDQLINDLSRLTVSSSSRATRASRYKGQGAKEHEIGTELGVKYVLEAAWRRRRSCPNRGPVGRCEFPERKSGRSASTDRPTTSFAMQDSSRASAIAGRSRKTKLARLGLNGLSVTANRGETRTMSRLKMKQLRFRLAGPNHRALWRSDGRWKGTRVEANASTRWCSALNRSAAPDRFGELWCLGDANISCDGFRSTNEYCRSGRDLVFDAADVDEMSNPSVAIECPRDRFSDRFSSPPG